MAQDITRNANGSVTVATIKKNSREDLLVSLSEFKGSQLLGLRIWVPNGDAGIIPTKAGIAIKVELLGQLREALATAEAEARNLGWVP